MAQFQRTCASSVPDGREFLPLLRPRRPRQCSAGERRMQWWRPFACPGLSPAPGFEPKPNDAMIAMVV
jgi:hypothetical protein